MRHARSSLSSPLSALVAGALALVWAACSSTTFSSTPTTDGGSSGDDSLGTNYPTCDGRETLIRGTVRAPNGQDPVPGASVFIPKSVPEMFDPEVRCEVCGSYGGIESFWATTSGFDGSFVLQNVCPGPRLLVLQNGRFRRVLELDVPEAGQLDLTAEQTRLPRLDAEHHNADAIPRIAVATGDYDKMECVLRKMGLADGSYDMYEGAKALTSPNQPLPAFTTLVNDLAKMKSYNIIFINCTDDTFEAELEKPEVRDKLEQYVRAGGRLYVTDWSYDWIEQLGLLAPFIDFEPGPSSEAPETHNAAALGLDGLTVNATITQPELAEWLGLFPNAINGTVVRIEHFLVDWVIMHQTRPNDVKVWVEGEIESCTPGDRGCDATSRIQGVRPLTVTFNFENCGKVLFTSYHTEGRDDEWEEDILLGPQPRPKPFPQYCDSGFSPQDRILEYLIFDIASCVKPVQ